MFHRPRRLSSVVTAAVLLIGYVVAALALSAPANAVGSVTVTVEGHGTVTTQDPKVTPQISCGDGGTACSATIADDEFCIPGCITIPHTTVLAVTADPGYSITSTTSGACSVADPPTSGTCYAYSEGSPVIDAAFADITPPTVSLTTPSSGDLLSGAATVSADAGDTSGSLAQVDFFVNGVLKLTDTTAPYGGQVDTGAVNGPSVTVSAQATDSAGNQSELSSHTVTVDNIAPDLTVTGPENAVFGPHSTQTWTFNASDNLSGVASTECSVARSGAAPSYGACSVPSTSHTVTGLPGGAYVFSVRATDHAANVATVNRTFTVDATPPTVEVTKHPQRTVRTTRAKAKAVFAFASEPGATYRCTLDGKAVACGAKVTLKVKAGKHTLSVVAVDAVGNVSATSATVSWKVKRVSKRR